MNTSKDITDLYNSLFQLESKFKKGGEYPIHKRMDFKASHRDIYDYLISKIDLKNKTVLDAGCGVGFGSFRFAKNNAKKVIGISLSNLEIERAIANKIALNLENTEFKISSFDETPANTYDLVFCIESLKHALVFENSFEILLKSLKPNGKLYIVDDFFEGKPSKISEKLMKDWNLNFLFSMTDIKIIPNLFAIEVEVEDLTPFMPKKSLLKINLRLMFFKLLTRDAMFKKLFRGGLLLDKLYAKKQMKYQLIIISKKE